MGAKGYWAPRASLIANGKKTDLTPYLENSLNKNLLSQSAKNPAHLTALSFSRERFMTLLPILADFPLGEAVRPPKWLNSWNVDIERILITKHREEKVIGHILQNDNKLTNRKEEGVKKSALTTHQVSKALGIPKTFKIPRNRYWFQHPSAFQTTEKVTIRKLVHPTGPTSNLPRDKVEEDRDCLAGSSFNL